MPKRTVFERTKAQLNIPAQCRELNVQLWSCPQFLFLIMGAIIIASILVTYTIAQRYTEGEIVALIVLLLTVSLFIISYIIVSAFEQVVQARRAESKHAQELLELKDQFVFIAAHELKTPATAIKKGIEKLETKDGDFFERHKSIINGIKESNERLLALVQDLLQVARIEGKTIHIDLYDDVSISRVYSTAIKELEPLLEQRGVEVHSDIADNIPLAHADERRLKEVLVNFLSNAIKYSDPEYGKISFKAVSKNGEVVMSVSNNGPQISIEDQKHVFQKFWRSRSAQKSKTEGTGLGLFIVKQLVELMEGKTWFTSRPDETTFYVSVKQSNRQTTKV